MKFSAMDVHWLQKIGAINRETVRALLRQRISKVARVRKEFVSNMMTIEERINQDGLSIFDKEKTIKKEVI